MQHQAFAEPLTTRETEVLCGIARGWTNHRMGPELGVATKTIKRHITHLYGKLDVTSRNDAVRSARDLGIIV